jgi:hypothetical protein
VNNPATMTINGNLVMPGSAVLEMDVNAPNILGGTNDRITINGNLTLDGSLSINTVVGLQTGLYPLLTFTGSLTDLGMTTIDPANLAIIIKLNQFGGGTVYLGVIPEPSSLTLLGTGILAVATRRRRSRRELA